MKNNQAQIGQTYLEIACSHPRLTMTIPCTVCSLASPRYPSSGRPESSDHRRGGDQTRARSSPPQCSAPWPPDIHTPHIAINLLIHVYKTEHIVTVQLYITLCFYCLLLTQFFTSSNYNFIFVCEADLYILMLYVSQSVSLPFAKAKAFNVVRQSVILPFAKALKLKR